MRSIKTSTLWVSYKKNIAEIIKAVVNDQTSSFLDEVVFAVDGAVTSGAKRV